MQTEPAASDGLGSPQRAGASTSSPAAAMSGGQMGSSLASSTPGTSASPAAGTSIAPKCAELDNCCLKLSGDAEIGCEGVRRANNATACEAAITALCSTMPASATPSSASPSAATPASPSSPGTAPSAAAPPSAAPSTGGSGPVPPAAMPPATNPTATGQQPATTAPVDPCAALKSCCGTLDDDDDTEDCEEVVEDGDAAACTEAASDFECPATAATSPASGPASCQTLATCCVMLDDDDDQDDCMSIVEDADPTQCAEAATESCTAPGASGDDDDD